MNKKMLRSVFVASGLINIVCVLLFSRFFTNTAINHADPVVMSNFGLLMIMVWGLVFLGAATLNENIKWLAAAFAIEKLVYVVVWLGWLSGNSLAPLYSIDILAGIFYTIYGVNDFIFMVLFCWMFFSCAHPRQRG